VQHTVWNISTIFWITKWKTRQKYPPIDLAGGGGTLACGLVWLIFTTAIVF
jgi:hypothetical protein